MGTITFKEYSNGWTATHLVIGDEVEEETIVGEVYNNEDFAQFLSMVFSNWGLQTSRHDKDTLLITTIPGDKFEGELDLEKVIELRELRDRIDTYILKYEEMNGIISKETLHEESL